MNPTDLQDMVFMRRKQHNDRNSENRRVWKVKETAKAKTIPTKCFWRLSDGRGKDCIMSDQP